MRLAADLERAKRLQTSSPPYSPDWDAATEAVEHLTRQLQMARRRGRRAAVATDR